MPNTIAVNDIIRIVVNCYAPNQVAQNNYLYRVQAVTGTPKDQDFAGVVDAVAAPLYKAWIAEEAQYSGVILRIEPNGVHILGGPGWFDGTLAGPGTAGDTLQPTNVAGMVTKLSNVRGARGRGRVFLPFPPAEFLDINGLPDMAAVGPPAIAIATQFIGYEGANITWDDGLGNAVVVKQILKAFNPSDPTLDVVGAGFLVRTKWGTLHKRGDYGKPNYPIV